MRSIRVKHSSKGFTLLELCIIVIIVGILATIAMPKYIRLTNETKLATAESFASSLAAASAVNYAICQTMKPGCKKQNGTSPTVSNCSQLSNLLAGNSLPNGMIVVPTADFSESAGDAAACTINYGSQSVSFEAIVPPVN